MDGGAPARPLRSEMRRRHAEDGARALRRSIDRHDLTQHEVAEHVARPPQKVQLWCDHRKREEPTYSALAMLPRDVAIDLLRQLAAAHGATVVDAPAAAGPVALMSAIASAQREASEAAIAACDAIREDGISDAEARAVLREADEAGRAFLAIAESMRARLGGTLLQ